MRALNFLEGVDLVDGVVMKTRLTEKLLMLAVAHENLHFLSLFCLDLALTYLASLDLDSTCKHAFDFGAEEAAYFLFLINILLIFFPVVLTVGVE